MDVTPNASWWPTIFLWIVPVSGALLWFLAPAISRWTNRLLLVALLGVWSWLAGSVAMRAERTGTNIDATVVDGIELAVGCLVDDGWRCLAGQQKDMDFQFSPGVVTWIVLGALLVGFVRLLEIRNARGDHITIEVDDLTYPNPPEDEPDPDAATCTARMRTILATQVQTPPPLPGGEPVLSLPTVLYEAKPKEADLFTKLLALGWQSAFPQRGWRLTGHVQHSGAGYGVTVNITEKPTHRRVLQDTYWEDTPDEAVYKTAYTVSQLAMASTACVPRWTKWRSKNGRGLRHYRDGVDLLHNGGKRREAEREFRTAVRLDPANALARCELALLKEGTPFGYLQALEMYLQLTAEYPAMMQPRYRVGIVLDLVDEWLDAWLASGGWQGHLDRALTGAGLAAVPDSAREDRAKAREHFLTQSLSALTTLRGQLTGRRLLGRWIHGETRGLYRDFVRPFGTLRAQTRAAVDAAILSHTVHVRYSGRPRHSLANLRTQCDFAETEKRLEAACAYGDRHRFRGSPARPAGDGQALGHIQISGLVQYNAACFYARLIGPPEDHQHDWTTETEEAATLALAHLTASVRTSELASDWLDHLKGDPDLRHLWSHPCFQDWALTRHTQEGDGHDRREVGAAAGGSV
ncbi:hypothetical protein AB0L74_29175 [Streptomyces sp. NPDC052020]|uniref:tetratricopeptide repeat protein n=1 Tax=Streptomyces sp. NPDC052020 TaxID=3155677 RepID=UPI003421A490